MHLRSLPDAVWSVPAVRRGEDTQGEGRVGSDKTASTAAPSNSLGVRSSVIPAVGSLALEKAMGSPCSVETGKQVRNKAKGSKKVKQPKGTVEGIAASHAPAVLDRPGCNDGQVGFFVDSFPGNVRSDRWPKNLMCNQDCGRCGEYMNHLADEYDLKKRGERDQAKTSSASLRLILSPPPVKLFLPGRVSLRKRAILFRLSLRNMFPSNTTGLLHRMTNLNAYALSLAGQRIIWNQTTRSGRRHGNLSALQWWKRSM